jgi:NADP-dependent 3-hydroxy acid dehydrogenase YdfG
MDRLSDKIAIVTGASRGIGRAIARALASEGANVVLAARTAGELQNTVAELRAGGLKATGIPTDVSVEAEVQHLVAGTVKQFGRVDILVNNAGLGVFKPVAEMSAAEFDLMWGVNMRGVFLATRAVLPHMIKARSGQLVNIASLAGKNAVKGGAVYASTKWALRGFAASLMLEVREANIRVITIFPGSVDTSFSSKNLRGAAITQPEDVADAVLFAVRAPGRTMVSEIDVRPTIPK